MYLQNASKDELLGYFNSSAIKRTPVAEVLPFLADKIDACFIMGDDGKKLGYSLTTGHLDNPKYSRALVEIAVDDSCATTLHWLIPNLVRQFKLQGILVRSDDCTTLRVLAHFSFTLSHMLEIYEIPEEAPVSFADRVALISRPTINLRKFLEEGDDDILGPETYSHNRVEERFELKSEGRIVGAAIVQDIGIDGCKAIVPAIRPNFRRKGLGSALIRSVADKIREKGHTPLLVIKPENDRVKRMSNRMKLISLFDLIRVHPRFHISSTFSEETDE